MPEIAGQKFTPYEFQEFPKTVYEGGDITAASEVVGTIGEQDAAAERGFLPIATDPAPVADEDPVAEAATDDEAFNGADPADFDHDGDGKPGGSKPKKAK